MAYDERLAEQVRVVLAPRPALTERKMFGGLAFMLGGHMCCGVVGDELMARVGPDGYDDALARAGARPMDFTGRVMKGMVFVGPAGLRGRALEAWVERTVRFVETLPPK